MILIDLQNGNTKALEELYSRLHKRLYFFVLKIINDTELAEDVVHSTFIKVWDNREKLSLDKPLDAQIYVIARNILLNHIKRQSIEKKVIEKLLNSSGYKQNDGMRDVSFNETLESYEKAIDKLPPRRKEIFKLSRIEGLSNKEISEKLSISINTVEVQMTKALAAIRKELKHLKDQYFLIFISM